jgi:YHS domain-containing protein
MTTKDVVCEMDVDVDRAPARSVYGDRTFVFCSNLCKERFDADPPRYAQSSTAAGEPELERHEPPRTTKGQVTNPKFGSAGSGGLEYERLPEMHEKKPT